MATKLIILGTIVLMVVDFMIFARVKFIGGEIYELGFGAGGITALLIWIVWKLLGKKTPVFLSRVDNPNAESEKPGMVMWGLCESIFLLMLSVPCVVVSLPAIVGINCLMVTTPEQERKILVSNKWMNPNPDGYPSYHIRTEDPEFDIDKTIEISTALYESIVPMETRLRVRYREGRLGLPWLIGKPEIVIDPSSRINE